MTSGLAAITSELLDTEVVELMTPGCVTISEEASVGQAAQALAAHRSHAVLVVGTANGTPLGWVTARGLLGWLGAPNLLPEGVISDFDLAVMVTP
jgi:CBS domain-containing protein